jgi:arylsulfatase A-like enzyme
MDRLARESINFTHAVSCAPVCSPYRASLLTGQYPLTHGVFVNDVCLSQTSPSLADLFNQAGYSTAYIGKWHLDGHGRSSYIPIERRQGFETWQVLECTHDYNHSYYYDGDDLNPRIWEGYDALAQTRSAQEFIRGHDSTKPFLLVLSWGPPHNPYETAPEEFQALYSPEKISFRANVSLSSERKPYHTYTLEASRELAGYYAHISALDYCLGELLCTLDETGQAEDTIFIYTSDHGDMLWSHGKWRKQWPMDEAIRVPFLLRYPACFGDTGKESNFLINTPDILPTLLGLCDLPIPGSVEGFNYAPFLKIENASLTTHQVPKAALIECIQPFSEFQKAWGGREYRGLRSQRYTYVRDLRGPWLLFDNEVDPNQLNNLCDDAGYRSIRNELDLLLSEMLSSRGDDFLPGEEYMRKRAYPMDQTGAVPFDDILYSKP